MSICQFALLAGTKVVSITTNKTLPPDTMEVRFDAPNLWIYVSSWGEGMSSRMISVSELLLLAHSLNASLVEPCLVRDHLVLCDSKEAMIAFRDVFDMSKMKEFYPHFLSHEQFRKRTVAAPVFPICMQEAQNRTPAPYKACGNLTSRFGAIVNPELENAIFESYNAESVFKIAFDRCGAIMGRLEHGNVTLASKQAVSHVHSKYFHFKKDHNDLVDKLLKKMGIAKHADFSVIHWRAELKDIDYIGCARDIMRARDFMNQKDTPFVLMSSLNTNWDHMWGGARNEALNITNKNWNNMLSAETNKAMNSTSMAALKLLMDSGFLKLDSIIDASRG